jgi:hypothetical protein
VNCVFWRPLDLLAVLPGPRGQAILLPRTFPGFHKLATLGSGQDGVRNMTGQLIETPRDSFMEAAQREMIAFERKEREFRKREKQERAEQLDMPALKNELNK